MISFFRFFPNSKKKTIESKKFSTSPHDLTELAKIIKNGGVIAFPFNGIFGLIGDNDNKQAYEKIYIAKNRPKEKKLVKIIPPELIHHHANIASLPVSQDQLVSFWKDIHALGIILPAKNSAETILNIWTEYEPLRKLFEEFQKQGGRAFVGTSANKSGRSTHTSFDSLWNDFKFDIDAMVEADFDHLDKDRKKSTTVIKFDNQKVFIHRSGNVNESELVQFMKKHQLPDLNNS